MSKNTLQDAPVLFVDTLRQFSSLMQGEMRLARTEMSRIVSRAGVGVAMLAVAFLLALVALNVLASAAVAFIAEQGISVGLAALIVGGGLILFAIIAALMGKNRLSAEALAPTETSENIRRDFAAIKEAANV